MNKAEIPYALYQPKSRKLFLNRSLAEQLAEQQKAMARSKKGREEYERELNSLTLAHFVNYTFFKDWTDYPSKRATQAARAAMKCLVNALVKLGPDAPVDEKAAAVRSCILSFNQINDKYGDFIDTGIREDVVDEVWGVAYASGLGDIGEQIDGWRLW